MSLQNTIARANEQKYKTYLYNALVYIQEMNNFTDEELLEFAVNELGIIETQFYKIFNID